MVKVIGVVLQIGIFRELQKKQELKQQNVVHREVMEYAKLEQIQLMEAKEFG